MPSHRRLSSAILLAAALAWGQGLAAQQVEVHLTSGQTVSGELENEGVDTITVKVSMPTKNGKAMSISKDYARTDIKELVRLKDPEDAYKDRDAAAKTADDHAALAAWCRDQSMTDRAIDHAKRALALDPKQEAATKLLGDLGYVLDNGKWVKESDWLASQGKVRYEGRIMTIAEADALKAQEKLKADVKAAQQVVDDKTAGLAALDRRIADLPKRPAEIDKELTKDQADLAKAQGAAAKVTDAKTALDAAQKSLTDAQNAAHPPSNGTGGGNTGGHPIPTPSQPAQDLSGFQKAVEDAQKSYNAARRDASTADADAAQLKAKIAGLTDEKKNLAKKGDELKAQRESLAKDLEQAKSALDEATKKASAAPSTAPPATP
jgi:predicted  nucleic acid-binding Zn-ribbon protein